MVNKNIYIASVFIITAGTFFVTNDAIINYLAVNKIKFYHFIFYGIPAYLFVPFFLFFKGKLKENLKCTNYYIPIIRSFIFAPMPFITFICLENIKLPEFTTLNMASPLVASFLAIFFLNEKLNFYTLCSLILGFFGVIFVIQPGFDNFNFYFIVTLIGVVLITITTLIVNKYHYVTSAAGYFIYGGSIIHIISILLFIYDPIYVSYFEFFLITTASIFINAAIFLVTFALRMAQKYYSSVFCLVYLQVVWSSLVGIFIFNEYMNMYAYIGALLIVLSGIFSIPSQIIQLSNESK